MTNAKKQVLVVCSAIMPGGGPPGYTHNLREGIRSLETGVQLKVSWRFFGHAGHSRNRSTGESLMGQSPRILMGDLLDRVPARLRRLLLTLKWFFASENADLKHAIDEASVVVFQGYQDFARMRHARRRNKAVIYMPHSPSIQADEQDMMYKLSGKVMAKPKLAFLKANERQAIQVADMVVFPTRNAAGSYYKEFGLELEATRVEFIRSGITEPRVEARTTPENHDVPTVLFVGRYVEHKGYDLFADAAEFLKGMGVTANFVTLGAGPMKRDTDSLTDLGWSEFPHDVVKSSSLVVIPNRLAYFDLLPLEVAALGRPLVMTEVGGNLDQLEMLPDSLGCELDAVPQAIRDGLQKLKTDPNWGAGNRTAFEANFTADKMAESWDALMSAC